jgi:hypothetical protein
VTLSSGHAGGKQQACAPHKIIFAILKRTIACFVYLTQRRLK